MTEKGTNMRLVADELVKLFNKSNKNDDNETMQLLSKMLINLISKGISKNDLDYSIEIINKYLNGDADFGDITKSFVDALNKKEEQKASEPKLSETDIENTKQTNKIWQEYLLNLNKNMFDKIIESNYKFDNNNNDIFTGVPDVNKKIKQTPNIDMLNGLFLGNVVDDKNKETKESNENNCHWNEKIIKEFYDKLVPLKYQEKNTIDDIVKRLDSLERENKKINNHLVELENKIDVILNILLRN